VAVSKGATDLFAERWMHCEAYFLEGSIEQCHIIMYEGQSENDPDNYALSSLEGVTEEQNRKK